MPGSPAARGTDRHNRTEPGQPHGTGSARNRNGDGNRGGTGKPGNCQCQPDDGGLLQLQPHA
jgi:hypothetical protein